MHLSEPSLIQVVKTTVKKKKVLTGFLANTCSCFSFSGSGKSFGFHCLFYFLGLISALFCMWPQKKKIPASVTVCHLACYDEFHFR